MVLGNKLDSNTIRFKHYDCTIHVVVAVVVA